MKGYWLVRSSAVKDQQALENYARLWPEIGEKYGANIIAGRGAHESREGEEYPRVLLIEFPSYQQALDCYDDPDYQASLQYVRKAFDRELIIVEGLDV